jgi:hypothetical protein
MGQKMSLESIRAFFAEKAPDIAVIESRLSSATVALAACRPFVEHPFARMTAICAVIRRATPERAAAAME